MSETIRAFVAFDIDSEQVLKRFSQVQASLTETGADLKMVEPKNIHTTIRFLGNVSLNTVQRVREEMAKVSFEPFDMEIKGLGAFPTLKYIRVIWAGIQKGAEPIRSIFNQLEPRLQKLGFSPDRRGFSPHLTIARVKSARNKAALADCIKEFEEYEFGKLEANCLKLKKSVLTPKGPVYSTIHEVRAESEDSS